MFSNEVNSNKLVVVVALVDRQDGKRHQQRHNRKKPFVCSFINFQTPCCCVALKPRNRRSPFIALLFLPFVFTAALMRNTAGRQCHFSSSKKISGGFSTLLLRNKSTWKCLQFLMAKTFQCPSFFCLLLPFYFPFPFLLNRLIYSIVNDPSDASCIFNPSKYDTLG